MFSLWHPCVIIFCDSSMFDIFVMFFLMVFVLTFDLKAPKNKRGVAGMYNRLACGRLVMCWYEIDWTVPELERHCVGKIGKIERLRRKHFSLIRAVRLMKRTLHSGRSYNKRLNGSRGPAHY